MYVRWTKILSFFLWLPARSCSQREQALCHNRSARLFNLPSETVHEEQLVHREEPHHRELPRQEPRAQTLYVFYLFYFTFLFYSHWLTLHTNVDTTVTDPNVSTKYNLLGNICHDGQSGQGTYRAHVLAKGKEQWLEVQDLMVKETLPQLISLSEAYLQIYELKPAWEETLRVLGFHAWRVCEWSLRSEGFYVGAQLCLTECFLNAKVLNIKF